MIFVLELVAMLSCLGLGFVAATINASNRIYDMERENVGKIDVKKLNDAIIEEYRFENSDTDFQFGWNEALVRVMNRIEGIISEQTEDE